MDIVGTVSAAISFVDFIVKAVNVGKEAAESGQAVKEHEELDALASTVGQGYANLQQKLDQKGHYGLSPEEASLLTVLKHCTEVHAKIRKLRDEGEVQKPGKAQGTSLADKGRDKLRYGLKISVVAIRAIWNTKEDGESLRAQFAACSVALNSALLLVMRQENLAKWDTAVRALRESLNTARDSQQTKGTLTQVIDKCDEISVTVSEWSQNSKIYGDWLRRFEEKFDQHSETYRGWQHQLGGLKRFFAMMDNTTRELAYLRVLHDISFPEMQTRRGEIQDTHPANYSFKWLLDGARISRDSAQYLQGQLLRRWLRDGNGVFYITGKPGSGKSTVMNFLSDHVKVREQLEGWLPSRQTLVVATAFFWNLGSSRQKSKDGLVRTLLHSILATDIDRFVPWLFPESTTQPRRSLDNPVHGPAGKLPIQTVEEKLEHLINNAPADLKLCFFIDGADEFQDAGTEDYELAQLLSRWTARPWVKVCLAGREQEPWLEYFGKGARLRLHEANSRDIRLMVEKSISTHHHFLSFGPLERERFIARFVEMAEGVFLWVRYVKPEIVEALNYRQKLERLYEILDDSPTEMGPFYKRMFGRIKTREAWVTLRIMLTAASNWKDPNCLLAHHFSFVVDVLGANDQDESFAANAPMPDNADQNKEIFKRLGTSGFLAEVPLLFRGVLEATVRERDRIYSVPADGGQNDERRFVHHFLRTHLAFTHLTVRDYLIEYLEGRMGNIPAAQHRLIHSKINEPKLVLQLMTRQVLAHWDDISPRRQLDILDTVIPWLKNTDDCGGYFAELNNLEIALMRRQSTDWDSGIRIFLGHSNCHITRITTYNPMLVPETDFEAIYTSRAMAAMYKALSTTVPKLVDPGFRDVVFFSDETPILSVFALCAGWDFCRFHHWLRENRALCKTDFITGRQQIALINLLFHEFGIGSPGFNQALRSLLHLPALEDGSTSPVQRILEPSRNVSETYGIIGPADLTVSDYVLLTIIESHGFFTGKPSVWRALSILLEHGAKMNVLFRVHEPLNDDFVPLAEAISHRRPRTRSRYVTIEAAGQGDHGERTCHWSFKPSSDTTARTGMIETIIRNKFSNAASLGDLFSVFGPKNNPDLARTFATTMPNVGY